MKKGVKLAEIIKSGKEIVNEFFNELIELPNIDKGISEALVDLYRNGKLTPKNIDSALQKMREDR